MTRPRSSSDASTLDRRPRWLVRVRWLWRSVESPAWRALWAAVYDGGDCEYRVTYDGRVWRYGYDGGHVGLISGPCALVT